jgi:hypothetical protein
MDMAKEGSMTATVDLASAGANDFALRGLKGLTEQYIPPPLGDFTPEASWNQSYVMYVLIPHGARKVGEFTLAREAKDSTGFTLNVQTRRYSVSGFSQFERAEIQCKNDALASPVSWLFDTKLAQQAGDPPYLQSGRRRSGAVRDGMLLIADKIRTYRTALEGAYSNEWTLLEAVQRLPGEQTPSLRYTLIDEYDLLQPSHRLAYRDQVVVPVKSSSLKLHSYCDLGAGVIPTTYWVDEHHRLVFVCTGLQVYALNATNGRTGSCPDHYNSSVGPDPLRNSGDAEK